MAKQTFTTGQVLTAAQMTSLQQTAMGGGSATAKTASYVLTAADAGTTVIMNAAGATTITVNTALFAAGDTVNIQNIGAGTCTVTAGTATVNTAGSLALAQYEGGVLYFVSTSVATYFDYFQSGGSTPKILQVVTTSTATSTNLTTTSYTDLTNMTVTITPTSASSTILFFATVPIGLYRANTQIGANLQLLRGATVIYIPTNAYNGKMFMSFESGNTSMEITSVIPMQYLDSPGTTSATTYKLQGNLTHSTNSATGYFGGGTAGTTLTVMEVS